MQPPPPTPQAPPPPTMPGGSGTLTIPQAPARPLTGRELTSLRARRTELSNQLESADSRRERLSEALQEADGATRVGLLQRISLLDKRILQLETDIAETGRQLTSAPSGLVATTVAGTQFGQPSMLLSSGQITAISIVFTLSVLAPLAIAAARRLWKRAAAPLSSAPELKDVALRLERLEQAVDTVAIEVERVSEGQRYVTRILSEAHAPPALAAGLGPAEPIRVPQQDAVPVRRAES